MIVGRIRLASICIFLPCISNMAMESGPTLAVLPFKGPDTAGIHATTGAAIAEHISSFIGRSGMVRLVERIQLEKVAEEIALGQTGIIDESSAVEAGKMAGATHVVVGSFERHQRNIKVQARIVEVASGLVKGSSIGKGSHESEVLDRVSIGLLDGLGVKSTPVAAYVAKNRLGWSGLSCGALLAGAAVWSHLTYQDADIEYRSRYDLSAQQYEQVRSRAELHMNGRYYLAGSSGVLLTAGLWLMLTNRSQWIFSRESTEKRTEADSFGFELSQRHIKIKLNF